MKVRVTFLKAPWPEGTKVGDVVDVPGDAVPPWAFGKCDPVAEDSAPAADAAPEVPKASRKK